MTVLTFSGGMPTQRKLENKNKDDLLFLFSHNEQVLGRQMPELIDIELMRTEFRWQIARRVMDQYRQIWARDEGRTEA